MSRAEGRVNGALYFDFALDVHAPNGEPNFDPRAVDLDIAAWSENEHGNPLRYQGVPRIIEVNPEPEDVPNDLIIDQSVEPAGDKDAFLVYFTARLTGSMVRQIANGYNECEILTNLVPLKNPGPPLDLARLGGGSGNLPLADVVVSDTNMWGWLDDTKKEYICTLACMEHANRLQTNEIYRVVIHWNFWLTPPNGEKSLQAWCGFDDAVHFTVRGAVS